MDTSKRLIIGILLFSIVINAVFAYRWFISGNSQETQEQQKHFANQYTYLSRRIFVENPTDIILNFIQLRAELNEYIKTMPTRFGMYFEYLPSGVSIGINEKEEVRLASLGKVATVMAIYKRIAAGKLTKNDMIQIQEKHINKEFGTLWERGVGVQVPLEEIIKKAITESDNTSHNMLLDILPAKELDAVYESFDIPGAKVGEFPAISPKNYSSILRSLYLSAYLPFEYSNEILELMTKSIYVDKLPAGVDKDIKIAHKVGTIEAKDPQVSSFSDCGIVYVPNRPYILCMIISQTDNTGAQKYMSNVSKIIYEYVRQARSIF